MKNHLFFLQIYSLRPRTEKYVTGEFDVLDEILIYKAKNMFIMKCTIYKYILLSIRIITI